MAIRVNARGEQFDVEVTPPHGDWHSAGPLSATEVLTQLSVLGCHSTDAVDALDASGANWRILHDADVLRTRRTDL